MDEILNKLVESELLTAETKTSLVEAFQSKLEEAIKEAKEETEVTVRAELTEQFLAEKDLLIEALDSKNTEFLRKHFSELQEDIESFRDLEAEFAERLVEAKEEMATALRTDMSDLVEKLDQYNSEWMQEHFVELEESINEVKKLQFGKDVYEAVAKTFEKNFSDTNETLNALKEATEELDSIKKELTESKKLLDKAGREQKMNTVLENLHGRPRELMSALLVNTPTEKLEEGYKKFIGRVLGENKTEKESVKPVLAESETVTLKDDDVKIVTGDDLTESDKKSGNVLDEAMKLRLQKLAGLTD